MTSYYARGEYARKTEETAQQNSNMQAAREQEKNYIGRQDYVKALKAAHAKGDRHEIEELTKRRKSSRDKGEGR